MNGSSICRIAPASVAHLLQALRTSRILAVLFWLWVLKKTRSRLLCCRCPMHAATAMGESMRAWLAGKHPSLHPTETVFNRPKHGRSACIAYKDVEVLSSSV